MDSDVQQLLFHGLRNRAFEKILDLYANKVFRLVLSLLGNASRAEEVSQDVFLKIWQSLDVFDPKRAAVGTWIYRIAMNEWTHQLRRRRSVSIEIVKDRPGTAWMARSMEPPRGENAFPERSRQAQVHRAVSCVPKPYRQMLKKRYIHGFSYAKMSRLFKIPTGTVMSRLHRAKQLLRAAWQRKG